MFSRTFYNYNLTIHRTRKAIIILTYSIDPLIVNSQDCMGRTALMYCAHYAKDEHLECIRLLLSFNANTAIKTKGLDLMISRFRITAD